MKDRATVHEGLQKAPTGINGFDEITNGGLPVGRASLVVGGPGSGKTLFSMQFLVNGAMLYNEPGVFFSFEESARELAQNVASLGIDLKALEDRHMIAIDQIQVEAAEIIETGEYDLEGLFLRLGYAIDSIGAKRVVLDTIESIFSSFGDTVVLRSELRRLFRFLKDKGVTAVITGEKGDEGLTRNGLEEYVSDAVIVLDNRVVGNVSTRRLRIIKYRGSAHGSNEYPFLIDEGGFSVLPITTLKPRVTVTDERITTGLSDLDDMLGDKGYYKGSSVLVTGEAGTGKTSFGAAFVNAACEAGRKAVLITFEESSNQLVRNMRSVGIDLQRHIDSGLLTIHADRPTTNGLEMHLVTIHKLIGQFHPEVVVIDPISSLMLAGQDYEVRSTLFRMVDYLKMNGITTLFTDLRNAEEKSRVSMVSSLVDTWILLENVESNGERNRVIRLVKSRGMPHSNQVREFLIESSGISILPPYVGPGGVLTGSARYQQEARDRADEDAWRDEIRRLTMALEQRDQANKAQVEALNTDHENEKEELTRRIAEISRKRDLREAGKGHMENVRSKGGE